MIEIKNRRHMLFLPANNPAMYKDVIIYKPDTIMFDLEDAVDPNEKDSARDLFVSMLNYIDYNKFNIETCVRINGDDTEWFLNDLEAAIQAKVNMIRLPKVDNPSQVEKVEQLLEELEQKYKLNYKTKLFIAIESALGVLNAFDICKSSSRVVGIALGGFDYLLDLNAKKIEAKRWELLYARQHLIHVASALKIDSFDVVFGNVLDQKGFEEEFKFIKALGFSGKSVIHPKQIEIIDKLTTPSKEEIEEAKLIIKEFEINSKKGIGVFKLNNKMVDRPVYIEAMRVVSLAKKLGAI
ncbi:MAG: citrate lyase subunit beta [Mycoplasma sp.]|nr:citrate lyase subunit beta [Mycoplasma sp.]